MQYLPNFSDYTQFEPTQKSFLDGKYFNAVFARHQEVIKEAAIIKISPRDYSCQLPKLHHHHKSHHDKSLLRVIVELVRPQSKSGCGCKKQVKPAVQEECYARHNILLILDHQVKVGQLISAFDSVYDETIVAILEQETGYHIHHHHHRAPDDDLSQSGLGTAFVIKAALDYLEHKPCNFDKIKCFARRVEEEYPRLHGQTDESFGWLEANGLTSGQTGLLAGGGLGALGGGLLIGGPAGLLGGAALGGLGGYILGKLHEREEF